MTIEVTAETLSWAQVHSGFLKGYDSVKGRVMGVIDEMLEGSAGEQWQIYVTGHSLGGALATLCAYELAVRR